MTIATGSGNDYGYMLESTFGVAPSGSYKTLRRITGEGVGLEKETYDSEEMAVSRALSDSRHGNRKVVGDFETELSPSSFNDLFMCLMGQPNWVAVLNGTPVTRTVTFSATGNTITVTSGGAFSGLYAGAGVDITGTGGTNDGFFLVAGVSSDGLMLTVDRTVVNQTAVSTTFTGVGSSLTTGTTPRSLSLERAFRDLSPDSYLLYTGIRVSALVLQVDPEGMANAVWSFYGRDATNLTTTTKNTYASGNAYNPVELDNAPFDGLGGSIFIRDSSGLREVGVIAEYTLVIDNDMGADAVVGSVLSPDILWGTHQRISGKMSVLFTDSEFSYKAFESEAEVSVVLNLLLEATDQFLTFSLPRCKLNSTDIGDVGIDIGEEFDFIALAPPSAAPGFPKAALVIHSGDSAGGVVVAPDGSPNDFTFDSQLTAAIGRGYLSAETVISGINIPVTAQRTAGTLDFSYNDGAGFVTTSGPVTIHNGCRFRFGNVTGIDYSVTRFCTVQIGDKSATFTETTDAVPDGTIDAFSFVTVNDSVASTVQESAVVPLPGASWNAPLSVSVQSGLEWRFFSVDDASVPLSSWSSSPATIKTAGATGICAIQVRQTSSATAGATVSRTLTVQNQTASFSVVTYKYAHNPVVFNGTSFLKHTANGLGASTTNGLCYVAKINVPQLPPSGVSWYLAALGPTTIAATKFSLSLNENGTLVIVAATASSGLLAGGIVQNFQLAPNTDYTLQVSVDGSVAEQAITNYGEGPTTTVGVADHDSGMIGVEIDGVWHPAGEGSFTEDDRTHITFTPPLDTGVVWQVYAGLHRTRVAINGVERFVRSTAPGATSAGQFAWGTGNSQKVILGNYWTTVGSNIASTTGILGYKGSGVVGAPVKVSLMILNFAPDTTWSTYYNNGDVNLTSVGATKAVFFGGTQLAIDWQLGTNPGTGGDFVTPPEVIV